MGDAPEHEFGGTQADGQAPWKKAKAALPVPNQGIGLFVDARSRASLRRLCRVAFDELGGKDTDRREAKKIWIKLLAITRAYWADRDRDNQATFGDIKADLRGFRTRLSSMLEAFNKLTPAVRRELNSDRMFHNGKRAYKDFVGEARAALDQLRTASDHVAAPNYTKVKAVAVVRCCSALATIWEEATSQNFAKTKEYGEGADGYEFTSPGVRFVQLAMAAIDSNVGFQQVHSWLTDRTQAKNKNK